MAGRASNFRFDRFLGVMAALSVLVWLGCGSPRERYKVLSFFFDGVPDPDAPKVVKVETASTGPAAKVAVIRSQHKPYADGNCDSCHRAGGTMLVEFEAAYGTCTTCHKQVPTRYPRMHGPVAAAACRWCHTPHESVELSLLKAPPIQVCTQCHDQQLLGNKPPQHMDGRTSCVACHFGHGGTEANFLRPKWQAAAISVAESMPASQPASQAAGAAASQAATVPGTEPGTVPATQAASVPSTNSEAATAPASSRGAP